MPVQDYETKYSSKAVGHSEMVYNKGDIVTVKGMSAREGWTWAQKRGAKGTRDSLVGSVCFCVCMRVCVCVCVRAYVCMFMYVCLCLYVYECMYVFMCVCICWTWAQKRGA